MGQEIAQFVNKMDSVKSENDVNSALVSLQDILAPMNRNDTLKTLREISNKEHKGQGMDFTVSADGTKLTLKSPYGDSVMPITDTATEPTDAQRRAAAELLKIPGFAESGKFSEPMPYGIVNQIRRSENLSEYSLQFNKALADAGSPYRVHFGLKENLPGAHGNTVYEISMQVSDSRTNQETMNSKSKYDSVR